MSWDVCGERCDRGWTATPPARDAGVGTLRRMCASTVDLPGRAVPTSVYDVLRSPGQSLDASARADFEERLGHDFSRVRVHADASAANSARALDALAYTVGPHIVFAGGRYQPGQEGGRRLLAHELTHVAQQRDVTDPPQGLRVGLPGDAAEREADRIAHHNASGAVTATSQPSLQRQPREPEDTRPRNLGPPVQEVPLPPRCSVILKGGKWSFKCEGVPGIGSTPEIPLPPWKIPERLKELLPKDKQGSGAGVDHTIPLPPAPDSPLPPGWFETLCTREPTSPICLGLPAPVPSPGPQPRAPGGPSLLKPIGVFWTWPIFFEHDQPGPGGGGANGGMTSGGLSMLNTVSQMLASDPTLQVQLRGHASSEGDAPHNMALSKRRAQLVMERLTSAQLGARVMDPVGGSVTAGCVKLEFGVWACGASQATEAEAKPEERNVGVTFLRNPPVSTGPFRLTPPSLGARKGE